MHNLYDHTNINKITITETTYLKIKVIPRSPKTELSEIRNENEDKLYVIKLKAIPEKGKANAELIKFLHKHFNVSKENIAIISGKTDRIKLVRISGT